MVEGAVSSSQTRRASAIAPYSEARASISRVACALDMAPMAAAAMYRYHDGLDEANGCLTRALEVATMTAVANGLDDDTNGSSCLTMYSSSCVTMYRSSCWRMWFRCAWKGLGRVKLSTCGSIAEPGV